MLLGLCFAAVAFLIDQFSKWYVFSLFADDYTTRVFGSYFNLVNAWNTGASFSMFDDKGLFGRIFLIVFALCVVVFLLRWMYREHNRFTQACLGLIVGGALGNVFDRVRFGAVYDFLDFHYGQWHWPAFNAADSFITVGAFLILIEGILYQRKQSLKEIEK